MKTKIDVDKLSEMTVKDYQAEIRKELKRLELLGETTNIVMLSDFEFKCKTVGAVILPGDLSGALDKFYKEQKKERQKDKDFGIGDCKFETDAKGAVLRINITDGPVKPSRLEKGMKKSKIKVKAVISKGEEIVQVDDSEEENEAPETATTTTKATTNATSTTIANDLDKIKVLFQQAKDVLVRVMSGQATPEDKSLLSNLQNLMHHWLGSFQSLAAEAQNAFKDHAAKIKEQYSKISAIATKIPTNAATNTNPTPTTKTIKHSVGKDAENKAEDVMVVQELLNKFGAKLPVDGVCGAKMIAAIQVLQRAKLGNADGKIEPNSATWTALASK